MQGLALCLLVVLMLLHFLTQDVISENKCSLKSLSSSPHLKLTEIRKIKSRKGGEPFHSHQKFFPLLNFLEHFRRK